VVEVNHVRDLDRRHLHDGLSCIAS
jgi:hypothetical protein